MTEEPDIGPENKYRYIIIKIPKWVHNEIALDLFKVIKSICMLLTNDSIKVEKRNHLK